MLSCNQSGLFQIDQYVSNSKASILEKTGFVKKKYVFLYSIKELVSLKQVLIYCHTLSCIPEPSLSSVSVISVT